jgi:hypothetical protein
MAGCQYYADSAFHFAIPPIPMKCLLVVLTRTEGVVPIVSGKPLPRQAARTDQAL